ncbi:MAG TPA: MoaD/ThiS family protein [Candidatus Brocadiales bacterium]|nr:MoaD/ThiS family protein [Candidatus Brocadiales bacterium]
MPVTVRIPTPLRTLTDGAEEIESSGCTIKEVINNLESNYPGIKNRLCDEKGQLRRFINFYVNDEDIRFQKNQDTPVKDGDQISIVPAIAGGLVSGRGTALPCPN